MTPLPEIIRPPTPPWALVLAGGDGTRLRPLTVHVTDDARPKQFCPLLDGETLLERTRRRVDLLVRFDRQVVVVSRPHAGYYQYLVQDLAPGCLAERPRNLDTGPGVLYGLLRVADLAGNVPIVIVPSDHYVSDDRAFMAHVKRALGVVQARPDAVVLLGIEASSAETQYGWIEAVAAPQPQEDPAVFAVRRFWEKPSEAQARRLQARGCLWNSFIMVGWFEAFRSLIRAATLGLLAAFEPVRRALECRREAGAVERLYAASVPQAFPVGSSRGCPPCS